MTTFSAIKACPVCGYGGLHAEILKYNNCPVAPYFSGHGEGPCNQIHGSIDIRICGNCNHMFNIEFDSGHLSNMYSSDLMTNVPVSSTMNDAIEELSTKLQAYVDHTSLLCEIGGGSGNLAISLAKHVKRLDFYEAGVPVLSPLRHISNIKIPDNSFTEYDGIKYDLIVMKQVLEHIDDLPLYLDSCSRNLQPSGLMYIEVPCAEFVRSNAAIFDIHYPHVHYFSRQSIYTLLSRHGFEIVEYRLLKNGHDFSVLCRKGSGHSLYGQIDLIDIGIASIRGSFRKSHIQASTHLAAINSSPFSLYGANAYCQSLLGQFSNYTNNLRYVYDDAPLGDNKYINGSKRRVPIIKPDETTFYNERSIIITSYLHDKAIGNNLRKSGYRGQIYTLNPLISLGEPCLTSIYHS